MTDFDYYAFEDKRVRGGKPYAVVRFNPKRARLERYAEGGEWVFSPTEVDMLIDPDPGESARPIDKAEADALIASGTLVVLTREDIAGFGR